MFLKGNVIILIIQIKTFWIVIIFWNVIYPNRISKRLCQTNFSRNYTIFLKVIYQLIIKNIFIVYLSPLESEFHIKAGTMAIWVLNPSPLSQCFFKLWVSTSHNKYFFIILKSILLFPLINISYMRKTSHFSFLSFCSITLILRANILVFILLLLILFHRFSSFLLDLLIIYSI